MMVTSVCSVRFLLHTVKFMSLWDIQFLFVPFFRFDKYLTKYEAMFSEVCSVFRKRVQIYVCKFMSI